METPGRFGNVSWLKLTSLFQRSMVGLLIGLTGQFALARVDEDQNQESGNVSILCLAMEASRVRDWDLPKRRHTAMLINVQVRHLRTEFLGEGEIVRPEPSCSQYLHYKVQARHLP